MNKKYKIGNFTVEIISQVPIQENEGFSLFFYEGHQTDYRIYVQLIQNLPLAISEPSYETSDRIYLTKNGSFQCFYKSRETDKQFYAYRENKGNIISIFIDSNYSEMLRTDVIFSLSGIEELVIKNKGLILHASYILKNNKAILFTGPSTIGKSTQADLWKKYADAEIINGDKSLITIKDNEFFAEGIPFSGSSKHCLNESAKIKAIICLKKGSENKLTPITSPQSFYSIFRNCYPAGFSKDLTNSLIDFVTELSNRVPVYEYACLPDESAVRFLEANIL